MNVELKTITSKLHENKLTFVAKRVEEEEYKHREIPIVIENVQARVQNFLKKTFENHEEHSRRNRMF